MKTHLLHLTPEQLGPWVDRLHQLERTFSYPIDNGKDRFTIVHGPGYHPFFSALGDAHFLLAVKGDEVIGVCAAVRKPIATPAGLVDASYVGDLKVRADHRGTGLAARMLARGLRITVGNWRRYGWRFIFGAAMRGQFGDVMRSARGLHLMRIARPFARLAMYFVAPRQLAELEPRRAPASVTMGGVVLSLPQRGLFTTTREKKDYLLQSTQQPWPLAHLPRGPAEWGKSHAAYLREAGQALLEAGQPGPACFALDERLTREREFLAQRGIDPGAACTIYALSLDLRAGSGNWVHLPTSEI